MRTIIIGRSRKFDIIIPDESVSRLHAEVLRNGNEFIYRDMSKNGSNVGGQMIHNERIAIASGTNVLMANRMPLPWGQICAMLPGRGSVPSEQSTLATVGQIHISVEDDKLRVGRGIIGIPYLSCGLDHVFCLER